MCFSTCPVLQAVFDRMAAAVCIASALASVAGGDVEWSIIKPSNTGIPGEELRRMYFDPEGNLWVAARWPFWSEGGLARWNKDENTWTVWSNWETPIPSPFINDVAFAPNGVIWIATGGGLVKKDGENWTVYTTANAPFLHNTIMNLDVDGDGIVWLNNSNTSTVNGAIFRLDDSVPGSPQWTMFTIYNGLPWAPPWGALSDVIVAQDGSVWVGNQTLNGLAKYDGASWTLYGGSVGRFGQLVEDGQGNIWLRAGVGGGNSFWKFQPPPSGTFMHFPAATTPTTMAVGAQPMAATREPRAPGAVYLGDWSGLVRKTVDGGASWTTFAAIGTQVFNIAPDPLSSDVWLGSPGAARRHDGGGVWRQAFNTYNTGLPWYWIDRFDLDVAGNLWFATGEAGLSRFDGSRWRNWGEHNAGSEPYPFAGNEPMGGFFMDSTGVGWMGGNGIARWEPASGAFTGFWNWQNNPGMGVTLFTSFAEDSAGNLFAATKYGNVMRFNGSLWVNQPPTPGGYTSTYAGVKCDPQGRVWAIGRFNAWIVDPATGQWTQLGQEWGLFDLGGANAYVFAPDGTLWIGTNNGLLKVVDPADGGSHVVYSTLNSLMPAKEVQGIDMRPDGLMGLSAHTFGAVTPFPNGVALIDLAAAGGIDDPDNWQIFTYADSPLTHYQLGDVKFDADGRLWISCISEGAVVLTPGPSTPANPADLNGDGVVDVLDLLILLDAWGDCQNCENCTADLNGDCAVDALDLLMLLDSWG
jgi:hypothetical protein